MLLVGAGDFGSEEEDAPGLLKAQVALEAMGRMGYDALTLGRRDIRLWTKGPEGEMGQVPMVCTNLIYQGQRVGAPYRLLRLGILDIALLGVISPSVRGGRWEVADPVSSLQTALASLPRQPDLVVVLANMSLRETEALSKAVPEVDVMLLSSEGITVMPVKRAEVPALIVSPGDKGMVLGGLRVSVDDRGNIIGFQDRSHGLEANIPDDPEMAALYQRYQEQLQRLAEGKEGSSLISTDN